MSTSKTSEKAVQPPKFWHRALAIFGAVLVLIATWTVLSVVYDFSIIGYANIATTWVLSNRSVFGITVMVGFGGSLLSIPLLRRRGRRRNGSEEPLGPMARGRHVRVHPLMLTPRPARDSQFVIRKTKKRGLLSWNRDGERLPAPIHD